MKFKKIILVTFMVLAILTIGVVSAAENTNDTITDKVIGSDETRDIVNVEDTTDDAVSVDDNEDVNSVEDESEILTANPKTFTDLNAKINDNDDSEVYLDGNYTYELGTDDAFKEGVVVGRAVTIYGNGFTISGDGVARIFSVSNGNVVFYDIIFTNGKTGGYGGAINGNCHAINCTFTNNQANNDGGAMSGGSASNCTFINNQATHGGAMTSGSAINCTFTNNQANTYGGAIYYSSAINCTFTQNKAYTGGAMYSGSATNCTFTNNQANNNGGAISSGSATNCTFTNNQASSGGAMYGESYTATDCKFNSNNATNGGATYKITANNCQFTQNTATENGGAMYEGTANNCIFTNNKAGISGDNTYNTTVPKPVFSVSNYSSIYNSGAKLVFTFTTPSGLPINDANITIRIYKNNNLIGTYYALSGDGWVVSLDAGSYIAVCSIENQAYEVDSVNATLTITKDSTKITSTAITTVYNGNKYLVVTLKDSENRPIFNATVSININGVKTLTTDKNGQVKLSTNDLAPNTYAAQITFNGNNNYIKSATTAKVTVKKATPKLTAKAKSFKKSVKVKKYTVILKTNQNKVMKNTWVSLKINKKTYKAKTNSKGKATFEIKKLSKNGTFKAIVTFKATKYYDKVTKKVNIKIK